MDNIKERAELADICYMTIERECSKPMSDMNTELVTACIELAELLLDIHPLSNRELIEVKQKLSEMTRRRGKTLKVRIIAAVVAILLLLGTTVYAFSDWIFEVFGIETLQTIEPGDKVTVDGNVLDAALEQEIYDSEEELYRYFKNTIALPKQSEFEFCDATLVKHTDYDLLISTWKFNNIQIDYTVAQNRETVNKNIFDVQEHEYYSQSGQPYDIIDTGNGWQAATVTDKTQYTIFCADKEILIAFIDMLE